MLIFQVTVAGNYDGHNFRADSNAASLWMQRAGKWLNSKNDFAHEHKPRAADSLLLRNRSAPLESVRRTQESGLLLGLRR
jgi:hypothetical protein